MVTGVPSDSSGGGSTTVPAGTLWVFPSYFGELFPFQVTHMYSILAQLSSHQKQQSTQLSPKTTVKLKL